MYICTEKTNKKRKKEKRENKKKPFVPGVAPGGRRQFIYIYICTYIYVNVTEYRFES